MDLSQKRRMLDFCLNRGHELARSEGVGVRRDAIPQPESVIELLENAENSACYQAQVLLQRMSATVWQVQPSLRQASSAASGFEVRVGSAELWQVTCRRSPALSVWRILR